MAEYIEIVKGLRICAAPSTCEGCPRNEAGGGYVDCYLRLKKDAADAIEALEEKAMALSETLYAYEHPWISVTERLPQDGQDILAYLANEQETRILAANYDHGIWYDCCFNTQVDTDQITHWRPIPEPPKADKNN